MNKYIEGEYKAGKYNNPSEEDAKLYLFHKAQLIQMYYSINRLSAENFVKLDFTLNFGISSEVRAIFVQMIENEKSYEAAILQFKEVPIHMLLKLNRYFVWAN